MNGRERGVEGLLIEAAAAARDAGQTDAGRNAALAFGAIREEVQRVGSTGELRAMLALELTIVSHERAETANSAMQESSLDQAREQLAVAMELGETVRDAGAYRAIDRAHRFAKNRRGGLPMDEARQFFEAHRARLDNLERGYGEPEQKELVAARRRNLYTARRLYMALQREAVPQRARPATRESPGIER